MGTQNHRVDVEMKKHGKVAPSLLLPPDFLALTFVFEFGIQIFRLKITVFVFQGSNVELHFMIQALISLIEQFLVRVS